jgi:hypothetical protein
MMIFNVNGMNKGSYYWKCAAVAVLGYLILGFVTLLLWNWLVPSLFNGPLIDYWQSLGLLALSKILFWGFHKKHYSGHAPNAYWKQKFQQKLSTLDPSEREAFKQKMKEKWCRWEQQSQQSTPPSNTSND